MTDAKLEEIVVPKEQRGLSEVLVPISATVRHVSGYPQFCRGILNPVPMLELSVDCLHGPRIIKYPCLTSPTPSIAVDDRITARVVRGDCIEEGSMIANLIKYTRNKNYTSREEFKREEYVVSLEVMDDGRSVQEYTIIPRT